MDTLGQIAWCGAICCHDRLCGNTHLDCTRLPGPAWSDPGVSEDSKTVLVLLQLAMSSSLTSVNPNGETSRLCAGGSSSSSGKTAQL